MDTERIHTQLHINDPRDPFEVIDALFLEAFLDGPLRRARSTSLQRIRPDATLLPPRVRPVRVVIDDRNRAVLARGDGWVLRARRWQSGSGDVAVVARTQALADRLVAQAARDACEPLVEDSHHAPVGFWRWGGQNPVRAERKVAVAPWAEIRRNYTASTATAVDRLVAQDPAAIDGRLLLLHGPPGTGKTTLLRALAVGWRPWCRVDCALDPEAVFGNPNYLLRVGLDSLEDDEDDDGCRPPGRPAGGRWRLLILEDCDELIRPAAKERTGQGLARLLNVTDGLLGQGLRLLVAITTNEPLAALHPAVTRPGRRLAQLEVGRLTPAEARRWLGRKVPGGAAGYTLAELVALERGAGVIGAVGDPAPPTGQYL